jgi:hypothetical protein
VAGTAADACTHCGAPLTHTAGETLFDGRIQWFLEADCPTCGHQWIACGRDTPDEQVRTLLIEQTGLWTATIDDATASGTTVMRTLRNLYLIGLDEARARKDQLRGQGMTGTRGELQLLAHRLEKAGIRVTVTNQNPTNPDQDPNRDANRDANQDPR